MLFGPIHQCYEVVYMAGGPRITAYCHVPLHAIWIRWFVLVRTLKSLYTLLASLTAHPITPELFRPYEANNPPYLCTCRPPIEAEKEHHYRLVFVDPDLRGRDAGV